MAQEHFERAIVRSSYRVWIAFDATLDSGAFVAGLYSVTGNTVRYAYSVTGSPHVVELALGTALVDGATASIAWASVPIVGNGNVSGTISATAPATPRATTAGRATPSLVHAGMYGRDLDWNGDLVETPSGDLALIAGLDNVRGALDRQAGSGHVLWRPNYSPRLDQYTDSTGSILPAGRNALDRSLVQDDRVKAVSSTLDVDENTGQRTISTDVTLIGDEPLPLPRAGRFGAPSGGSGGSSGGPPTGPAGGDLGGYYPNPSVRRIWGATVPASPNAGDVGKALVVSGAGALTYALLSGLPDPQGVKYVLISDDGETWTQRQLTMDDILPGFAVSSFARASGGLTVQIGTAIATPAFTAAYTSTPDDEAGSVVLTDSDGHSGDVTTTPTTFASAYSFTKTANNAYVIFTLTAKKGDVTATRTLTISWLPYVFWGVAGATVNASQILALTSSALASSRARTYQLAAGTGEYCWYCYPASYGQANVTIGGFEGGVEAPQTVSVTQNGVAQNYYAIRSVNPNLGEGTSPLTFVWS